MNFIAHESAQKLRGGFYTDPDVAVFLANWVLECKPKSILEPSCGDGALLEAVLNTQSPSLRQLVACELNADETRKAHERTSGHRDISIHIHHGDFLKWFLFNARNLEPFDGIIGNPPFIRYQYLAEEQQELAERIIKGLGLPFTKHTNLWVPMVVAALALLAPGGRLGMVIPAEIFHIPHAQSLRTFLATQCSRTLILDPEGLWFDEAQQGIVLLLAEKKTSHDQHGHGVAVRRVAHRAELRDPELGCAKASEFAHDNLDSGKWMTLFLSAREHSLLKELRANPNFAPFKDLATVDVGIVTGANDFFLVPDKVIAEFELQRWAHPMFGRSEHVDGVIYDDQDHQAGAQAGRPTNFLWFDDARASAFPPRVQQYLRKGEELGLPERYKCQVRQPWFRVPSVYATPVAMLKRAHHFHRLVWNKAHAFTTDTAYRIQPVRTSAISLVHSFLNSLTALYAELEGRHYGGGVLELVPSEIEQLLLPVHSSTEEDLRRFDARFRASADSLQVLPEQDQFLLGPAGLSISDQHILQQAWDRLRIRRQRGRKSRTK